MCTFVPRNLLSKPSQRTIVKWDSSKQEKFSNCLILKENCNSLKVDMCFTNFFRFIDYFLQKQSNKSLLSFVIHFSNRITTKRLYIRNWQKRASSVKLESLEFLG